MSDADRWSWRNERMTDADRYDIVQALWALGVFAAWMAVLGLAAFFLGGYSRLAAGFLLGWASVPLLLAPSFFHQIFRTYRKHRARVADVRRRKRLEAAREVLSS